MHQGRKEGVLEVAKAVREFREDCEQVLAALTLKRQPTKDEVWIIQFYCKQLLYKIEPYLPPQSKTD